ncbi:hypothetical protein B0H11DRAFT_1929477 [Mycena galericulata]|nr:hypothetical protein B0H11DRAFT_1929477 [Mycena galericulata]
MSGAVEAASQAPQRDGNPLNLDLWIEIFHKHLRPQVDLSASSAAELQYGCRFFAGALQPLLYRHINLRSFSRAIAFFTSVAQENPRLARSVRTLQFSFEMTPLGADTETEDLDDDTDSVQSRDVSPLETEFWTALNEGLPNLISLTTLSVSYDHNNKDFLRDLLRMGDLARILPASVIKLHLKPLPEEYHLHPEDLHMDGPWHTTSWRLQISQIPNIGQLIVTTPTYVVWPPTVDQVTTTVAEWTAQLRRSTSRLQEIVIKCGFGDEGGALEKWQESHEGEEMADGFGEDRFGVQMVWRLNDKEWNPVEIYETSDSNREEYFFGPEGQEYNLPWLFVDEKLHGEQWRQSQRDEPRMGYCAQY